MADLLDFLPLYPNEDEPTVRARWNAWANDGIDQLTQPDEWVDVREGGFFQLLTEPGVRETARIYDLMGTEVVAAAFPIFAFGQYLDDHGATYSLDRLTATFAAGDVRFNGTNGTVIAAGTRVTLPPVDVNDDPPSYEVTAPGTIAGGTVEVPVRALETGEAGNVGAGAVTLLETPTPGVTSITNDDPIAGGTDEESDEAFQGRILARFKDPGSWNAATYESAARNWAGVGRATIIPEGSGPGTVIVIVMTAAGGPVSQSTIDGLQNDLDPPKYSGTLNGSHTLPVTPITVANTAGARDAGFVRIGDQLVQYTGRTGTTFTGATGGIGTFPNGTAVYQGGRGGGRAPIGHHVVVRTATALAINVAITIEPEPGYSIGGAGGTIDLTATTSAAAAAYIASVPPGGEVVRQKVAAAILNVQGVHDVSVPTLNGGGNISPTANPPQAPFLSAYTPTQGIL